LRRPTAIKLLPRESAGEVNVKRFEREVQLTSSLTHPNTIAIFDFGHTPDGIFYYAMEYLDGFTLEELVDHGGPQEPGRVVHLLKQVCGALAEAHAVGLVHRDIKPANLMLCSRGLVPDQMKVLDFGLVKEHQSAGDLSTTNALLGTPLYMAPETIRDPASVDARVDLYALGAVGYKLLVGEPVFDGKTVIEVCSHHLHTEPIPPSVRSSRAVPGDLERLVLSCLAKDPALRPASASAMLVELESLTEPPVWTRARAERWWEENAAALRSAKQSKRDRASDTVQCTLAVDLDGRFSA
jgi:serine/threonine-protein kinase